VSATPVKKPLALHMDLLRQMKPTGDFESVSGTQNHPSCCSGVFMDESAESVAPVKSAWRA
jgi:hypothetical protein